MVSATERLSRLMVVYFFFYGAFGLWLLIDQESVCILLDHLSRFTGVGSQMPEIPQPLWMFVTVSLLWMLAILCFWSAKDVRKWAAMIQLMIYCKFISAVLLIGYFIGATRYGAYFFGGLVDLTLGSVALIYWLRAFPDQWKNLLGFTPAG